MGENASAPASLEQAGLSFLQDMSRDPDSAERLQGPTAGVERLMTQIQEQGNQLRGTLRSVGHLARLSEDETTLVPEAVDAVELAREVLEHSASPCQVALEAPNSPIEMTTDAETFRHALRHLLSTAIMLTSGSEVSLHIDAADAVLEFRIESTGAEEPLEALSSLSEAFAQRGAEGSPPSGGIGLGLSLARIFAHHLGGTVETENDSESGDIFTLRASRRLAGAESSGAEEADEEEPLRLLVVEDNDVTQRLLRLMLKENYSVDMAKEAGEAVRKAEENAYDAFVLDVNLKGRRTGVEVLHAVRKMEDYASVPAVACTAYALDDHREQFLRAGFDDVVAKPVTKREILNVIDRALNVSDEPEPSEPKLSVAGIELPPIPTTLVKIAGLASSDPDTHDVETLTDALQKDQVISLWLIRHINSAYYGMRDSIETVERAVRYLGFRPVCNLVLTKVIGESFSGTNAPAIKRVQKYIMKTSTLTAFIGREVAKQFDLHAPEVAYTGGMFAQIGRLALLEAEGETYVDLWFEEQDRTAAFEGPPPQGQELLHFEEDYVRKGRAVGKACNLSDDLKAVLRGHRRPTQVDEQFHPLVPIIALALKVAHLMDRPEEEIPWEDRETLEEELQKFRITHHLIEQGSLSQQTLLSTVVDAAGDAREFVGQI